MTKNPIIAAIESLKIQAMQKAGEVAKEMIKKALDDLEAHGWDINLAAPWPKSTVSKAAYHRGKTNNP